jgi:hypothetical protein
MPTMPRSMRIDEAIWGAAVAKARAEGTSVTQIVEDFLRAYTSPSHMTETAVCNARG